MIVKMTIPNGLFITFEGPEGAGKSTQVKLLCEDLRRSGHDVFVTREPGGTPLGEKLRRLIKHFGGPGSVCPQAELLMFGASRAQHMEEVIIPQLANGKIVICDRFADSTTVYQGMARQLDAEFIEAMHRFTLEGRRPDLTLLLDIDVSRGFERTRKRNVTTAPGDRIEAESREFHENVRQGFLKLARLEPSRIQLISADRPVEQVHADILEIVNRVLG